MAMMPSRTKHRKKQKGSCAGLTKAGGFVEFGEFGMQSLDRGWISAQQIEACRVAITRHFSRKGKVWIRIFPDKPISKKPAETRMGKGKGDPEYWVARVREGTMLFEIGGVTEDAARNALVRVAHKMPYRCRFMKRYGAKFPAAATRTSPGAEPVVTRVGMTPERGVVCRVGTISDSA